jgi:hypothetical protein
MDNNNETTKHNCCCVTKGGNKECLNDFNCETCGVCMNWRGYEEGNLHCGCRTGRIYTDEEYLGKLEAQIRLNK